jgi:hypothetical protein
VGAARIRPDVFGFDVLGFDVLGFDIPRADALRARRCAAGLTLAMKSTPSYWIGVPIDPDLYKIHLSRQEESAALPDPYSLA